MRVSAKIPQSELRDFGDLLHEIVRDTRRDMASAVEQAAVFFCQSAAKASPQAKAKRRVESNPNRTGRGKTARGAKYRYRVYSQGKPWRWFYTDDRMHAGRKIGYAGALKNSWRAMIPKISRQSSSTLTGSSANNRRWLSAISARVGNAPDSPFREMTNRLSYLFDVTPRVHEDSLTKAYNRMNKQLELRRRAMEAAWRR